MEPSRYCHLSSFIPPFLGTACKVKRGHRKRESSFKYTVRRLCLRLPLRMSFSRLKLLCCAESLLLRLQLRWDCSQERVWAISIARLCTLPCLHLRPIDVIVSDDPIWRSYLEEGFVLRCFQHLSLPDAATRRCTWRYNRLTGGRSNTVLSY